MLAACAAAWAVLLDGRFEELDWRPGEHAQSLERAEHVRDWLLDRLQKRGETPARRLLRVQAREFKVLAAGVGERRPERWRLLVRESAAAPIVVARHGLLAAVSLYGFTTAVRLLRGDLRADAVEPGAVLGPLDELIAARILMAANAETTPSAVEALVNRARAVVPHAGWVLECANEARFACRRWTSGLFDDLEAEHKRRGLPEVSAERMLVAEALGRPREAVTSLRDLLTETRGTPHAPAADVVAALRRSGGAARPEVVQSLLQALPEDAPPAGPRLARSLYGGDVAQAIDRWRAALASRADELREAQAQREERLSAVLAAPPRPRRERPEVSAAGREGDLDQALAALRWRLDRPFFRDRDKLSLEAHAREALELVATGEDTLALPWLIALGEPNVGLVPALDELLYTGDGSAVAAALPRAERELARCLEAAWRAQTLRHLRVLLAELRGVDPHRSELTAGVVALQSAVASAATADQRTAIDRRITELRIALDQCAEVGEDPETAHSAEPDALMRTPDAALVRSRRDLDTPEWAITEGLRQVRLYNLSGGHRDLKKLRGPLGELWELRQSDRRRPVRVVYRLTPDGSEVVAILAKQNDAHQRRLLERISGWAAPG